jgi:sodium-dependent dicarboxylate transporter 2/3/5
MSAPAQSSTARPWRIAAGVCAAGAAAWLLRDDPKVALACAAAALMATWWVLEALPLWATSLVPLGAIPLLRDDLAPMARMQATCAPYFDPYVGLFLGGMCIGAAMQEHGLHRRFALRILLVCGSSPRRVLAGLLVATALVSMWISNTATTAMMLPVALAVALASGPAEAPRADRRGTAYLLAIAYASSVGGIATKIGTPPNAQFAGFMEQRGVEIGFLQFMVVGGGFVLLFLPMVWLFLSRLVPREDRADGAGGSLRGQLAALGPMSREERAIALVFVATALAWTASQPLADGLQRAGAPPWLRTAHVEGAIALAAALALKLMGGARPLLPWRAVRGVPWHTLVLLGGSFGLAALVVDSQAGARLALLLGGMRDAPPFAALLLAALATVGLSAIASNTATCGVMLAVLWQAFGPEQGLPILYGATIAASCDFALPAGTAPNAIVASSGLVSLRTMFALGACLDLAAVLVASGWVWLAVPLVHG